MPVMGNGKPFSVPLSGELYVQIGIKNKKSGDNVENRLERDID